MTNQTGNNTYYGYPKAVHELAERYIDQEIHRCDTRLVEKILDHPWHEGCSYFDDDFTCDDIINHGDTSLEAIEAFLADTTRDEGWKQMSDNNKGSLAGQLDFEPEPREIYEWWAVTDWLGDKLIQFDEPVLRNDYGTWWGRTCTGQAIILDGIMQKIAEASL